MRRFRCKRVNHAGSRRLADSNCWNRPSNQTVAGECEWCGAETTDLQEHPRLGLSVCLDCVRPPDPPKLRRERRPIPSSWIYFIQAGGARGPVKVGLGQNPHMRLLELQTGNHLKLRIVHKIPGTVYDEKDLHKQLARHHIRGEWFSADVLAVVNDLDCPHAGEWRKPAAVTAEAVSPTEGTES